MLAAVDDNVVKCALVVASFDLKLVVAWKVDSVEYVTSR
jgi:hypothetical protein